MEILQYSGEDKPEVSTSESTYLIIIALIALSLLFEISNSLLKKAIVLGIASLFSGFTLWFFLLNLL